MAINFPAFDMLVGGTQPFGGFGIPLESSSGCAEVLLDQAEAAEEHMRASQLIQANDPEGVCADLDHLVTSMRGHGWKPTKKSLNFWATDTGALLTKTMLTALGGELVFRSKKSLDHVSIWWPNFRAEAFSFHHALKCLSNKDGESFATFYNGVRSYLMGGEQRKE